MIEKSLIAETNRPSAKRAMAGLCLAAALWLGPSSAGSAQVVQPKIPEPQDIALQSKDGVMLAATFYPGTLGKRAVPIMMLHGWEGQRTEYEPLARSLQQLGYAVLTLDLRGHGRSTRVRTRTGIREIDRDRMGKRDISAMVLDVEAGKQFLLQKNNEGELNIELLCLVASDVSCIVAMDWAVMDWNARPLPVLKQGQDVKALLFLSPEQSFKGLTVKPIFTQKSPGAIAVRSALSVRIIVGKSDPRAYNEASRLYSSFRKFHPPPRDPKNKDLFFFSFPTSLQGTKLVTARGISSDVQRNVATFIRKRLISRQEQFPWRDRTNPLK